MVFNNLWLISLQQKSRREKKPFLLLRYHIKRPFLEISNNLNFSTVKKIKDPDLLRKNPFLLRFNNLELKAINTYCKKYKVEVKSQFMRESIITAILKKNEMDHPTLFTIQPLECLKQKPSIEKKVLKEVEKKPIFFENQLSLFSNYV